MSTIEDAIALAATHGPHLSARGATVNEAGLDYRVVMASGATDQSLRAGGRARPLRLGSPGEAPVERQPVGYALYALITGAETDVATAAEMLNPEP
ncbi:hypothetical protein [Saccharomonospora piscinae]|uniref:hypothetical protein n=1 Tax=Saccharomonospora piscinae TaxID=687388 RepID=UPI001AECE60A|nr:hypothetical protein [Saccharomonospora piscinae]